MKSINRISKCQIRSYIASIHVYKEALDLSYSMELLAKKSIRWNFVNLQLLNKIPTQMQYTNKTLPSSTVI